MLPALVRRFYHNRNECVRCDLLGDGFPCGTLHVDDLGDACVFEHWQPSSEELPFINVGTGKDQTIRDLAGAVARATGFSGDIYWDSSKPDGVPKKQLMSADSPALVGLRALIFCRPG